MSGISFGCCHPVNEVSEINLLESTWNKTKKPFSILSLWGKKKKKSACQIQICLGNQLFAKVIINSSILQGGYKESISPWFGGGKKMYFMWPQTMLLLLKVYQIIFFSCLLQYWTWYRTLWDARPERKLSLGQDRVPRSLEASSVKLTELALDHRCVHGSVYIWPCPSQNICYNLHKKFTSQTKQNTHCFSENSPKYLSVCAILHTLAQPAQLM